MYKIILPIFEGPLDLLLYFIKRDEINIYDIPIAKITDEFLNYLKMMQELDLEVASEFLVMASTLMEIKAKMLLPIEKKDNPEELEDPRKELVQQLIEYQVFKEISQYLEISVEEMKNLYYRGLYESEILEISSRFKTLKPATVYDLAKAFYEAMNTIESNKPKEIKVAEYKIEDAMEKICEIVGKESQVPFQNICKGKTRALIVLYFVAILELIKQGKIFAYQATYEDDIYLFSFTKYQSN